MPVYQQFSTLLGTKIAIWHISESESELLNTLCNYPNLLPSVQEIHHPFKRLQNLASRVALAHLAPHTNELKIFKDLHGKPHLSEPYLHVSFTHSHTMAGAALGTANVGIDLQIESEKVERVKHKFLTDEELDFCDGSLPNLCMAWCIKEAAYKLIGKKGISLKNDIVLSTDFTAVKIFQRVYPVNNYQLAQNYYLAVVEDLPDM